MSLHAQAFSVCTSVFFFQWLRRKMKNRKKEAFSTLPITSALIYCQLYIFHVRGDDDGDANTVVEVNRPLINLVRKKEWSWLFWKTVHRNLQYLQTEHNSRVFWNGQKISPTSRGFVIVWPTRQRSICFSPQKVESFTYLFEILVGFPSTPRPANVRQRKFS